MNCLFDRSLNGFSGTIEKQIVISSLFRVELKCWMNSVELISIYWNRLIKKRMDTNSVFAHMLLHHCKHAEDESTRSKVNRFQKNKRRNRFVGKHKHLLGVKTDYCHTNTSHTIILAIYLFRSFQIDSKILVVLVLLRSNKQLDKQTRSHIWCW